MNTFRLCSSLSLANIHSFRYSRRPGISAHYLDSQVHEIMKRQRMDLMTALLENQKKAFRASEIGETRHHVLWKVKRLEMGIAIGQVLTETYVSVEVKTCHDLLNTITPVRLTILASHLVEAVVLINATTNLQL